MTSETKNRASAIGDEAYEAASTRAAFWRGRSVFVTGATGFLGGVLVRQLLQLRRRRDVSGARLRARLRVLAKRRDGANTRRARRFVRRRNFAARDQ